MTENMFSWPQATQDLLIQVLGESSPLQCKKSDINELWARIHYACQATVFFFIELLILMRLPCRHIGHRCQRLLRHGRVERIRCAWRHFRQEMTCWRFSDRAVQKAPKLLFHSLPAADGDTSAELFLYMTWKSRPTSLSCDVCFVEVLTCWREAYVM